MSAWVRSHCQLLVVVLVVMASAVGPIGRAEAATPQGRDDVYTVTGGDTLTVAAHHAFDIAWGSSGTGDGQFSDPHRLAVDSLGYIYVTDSTADRVQKFAPDGTYVTQWGTTGSGDGQFDYPFGIAVDYSGYVYVVESMNHRVQKFTSDGILVAKWGTWGSGDGELSYPEGIAVDNHGYIYVVDTANSRIQKFSSNGNYQRQWGTMGTGDGQFHHPFGIATDSERNVYVTDLDNHRVQKFTSDGSFVTTWGVSGSGDGEFTLPNDIAIDGTDSVYVVDGTRVQKFTTDGSHLLSWGSAGSGDGQFENPDGIASDSYGRIYVADLTEDRVQRFEAAGVLANDSDDGGAMTAELAENPLHGELALEADGSFTYTPHLGYSGTDTFEYRATVEDFGSLAEVTINVLEGPNNGPVVLDDFYWTTRNEPVEVPAFHEFDKKWTACTPTEGMTTAVTGLGVDDQDRVYVGGLDGSVKVYTADGDLLSTWGSFGSDPGQFSYPHMFAFSDSGDVYISEYNNDRVQWFDQDGVWQGSVGGTGSGDGQFDGPTGVAFDSDGDLYVADAGNARVQVFGPDGGYLRQWGSWGYLPDNLSSPWGVAIDGDDYLYVTSGSSKIHKRTTDGVLITDWGEYGHGPGQSTAWGAIDFDSGVLFANDFENARIQKFTSDGRYLGEWGEWGTADHQFNSASGVAVDSVGRVYVGEFRLCTVKRFTAAGVLGNDLEPEGDNMGATLVAGPSHGSVALETDGSFVYTPEAGWVGTDTFTYSASDGAAATTGTVTIVVSPRGRFADDDESIFENDIEWLAENEITLGCNPPINDMFCPAEVVTRGQMAAFLVRALGLTDSGTGDPFTDDDGSIFEDHIAKLAAAGITKGCNPPDNTMFCPNDPVTRGQMAAFLVRALGYTDDGGGDLFTDDDGSVFEANIDKLATAGVTRGCNPPANTHFCPTEYVTRGQMAAFLHRALG